MKTCSRCRRELAAEEFHRSQTYCKACQVAYNREYRLQRAESFRERHRQYTEAHLEQERARKVDYHQRNPEKRRAHRAVWRAVKNGSLVRPDHCSECGVSANEFRIHAHHEDYGAPLDVEWLCAPCHGARHAKVLAA